MQAQPVQPGPVVTRPEPVVNTSWVQRLRNRFLARRVLMALGLAVGTTLFWLWLPASERRAVAVSLFANRTTIIALTVVTLVSLSLLWSVGQRMDVWAFTLFNARAARALWLDRLMFLLTQLGDIWGALAVSLTLYFRDYTRLAIELVLGLGTLWFIVETIKVIADRARPFASLRDVRIIGWKAIGRSFPSGHTAQSFFIASLLIHHFDANLLWTATLYALATLIGITRMYVGAHYPRDVIAGALLGLVWGAWATLIDPYLWPLPT